MNHVKATTPEATMPRYRVREALTDGGLDLYRVWDAALGRIVATFTRRQMAERYAVLFEMAEDGPEAWR